MRIIEFEHFKFQKIKIKFAKKNKDKGNKNLDIKIKFVTLFLVTFCNIINMFAK
jgi:hypothetical protein